MLNSSTKWLLGLTVVALIGSAVYAVVGDDVTGTVLFGFVSISAFIVALGTLFHVRDYRSAAIEEQPRANDVPQLTQATGATYEPAIPSGMTGSLPIPGATWIWSPVLAAVAAALILVGGLRGGYFVLGGLFVSLLAATSWIAQVWAEDAAWDVAMRDRLKERLLRPAGIPLVALFFVAFITVSLSRVMLATSKDASVVVAMVIAVAILGVCTVVAVKWWVGTSSVGLIVVALLCLAGAGFVGAASGEREIHHAHESTRPVLKITAEALAYNKKTLEIPSDADEVEVRFINKDERTIYHNVGIYSKDGKKPFWASTPVEGGEESEDIFEELPRRGQYTFRCDFHPNMVGTLTVQ